MGISHFGEVEFTGAGYQRAGGSDNWQVDPVEGFDPPIRVPLGQVEIRFSEPLDTPYTVIVTACRQANTPSVCANYGDAGGSGFVVHLWETCADRTLQNAGFSFAVLVVE